MFEYENVYYRLFNIDKIGFYEGFDMVVPLGLANAYEGYFPMQDSYDEGGYEAGSSYFRQELQSIL